MQFAFTSLAEPAEGLSGFEVRLKVVDLACDMNDSLWFTQSEENVCVWTGYFPDGPHAASDPAAKFIDEILTTSL